MDDHRARGCAARHARCAGAPRQSRTPTMSLSNIWRATATRCCAACWIRSMSSKRRRPGPAVRGAGGGIRRGQHGPHPRQAHRPLHAGIRRLLPASRRLQRPAVSIGPARARRQRLAVVAGRHHQSADRNTVPGGLAQGAAVPALHQLPAGGRANPDLRRPLRRHDRRHVLSAGSHLHEVFPSDAYAARTRCRSWPNPATPACSTGSPITAQASIARHSHGVPSTTSTRCRSSSSRSALRA